MSHRTPLRRVSRGSLAAISRSGNVPDAPHGLGFIGPALEDLADETEALHANVEGLNALAASLERFNESFSSYLFIQKVNVFCVEWFQAPVDESYELAERRADARKAAEAAFEALCRAEAPRTAPSSNNEAERTVIGDTTYALSEDRDIPASIRPGAKPKKKVKAKMTPKQRKERGAILEKVCSILPLEFRGGDPTLRRQVEHVIESLMDAEGPLMITDMIRGDINQAKVNKCLIPLVSRKVVTKISRPGGATYLWQGVP